MFELKIKVKDYEKVIICINVYLIIYINGL